MKSDLAKPFVLALAGASALTLAPRAAWSSACDEDVVAPIHFAPGSVCWRYNGKATSFVGDFGGGQTITVQMSGQASEFNPQTNQIVTSWQPRTPEAAGPGGFSASAGDNNILTFRTPSGGAYQISFSPCAMWGGEGQVEICAR